MNKYIFITTEGSTFQPNSDSYEPDIENMQVIGFGQGDSAQNALEKLTKQNEYLVDTTFDEIIAIKLANAHREYHYLSNIIVKNRTIRK
jgi:hypothetical protein